MKIFVFKKNSHTFRTEKHQKKRKAQMWIISLAAIILVFGSVSLFIFLKDYNYNISNIVGESTTETTEDISTETPPVATGNANIVLTLHDENNLKFLCIVETDVESEIISVCSVELDSESGKKLARKFKSTEDELLMSDFKNTVSEMAGITVDRYISADYSQFIQVVSVMGGVTMNIPQDINYDKGDIVLSLKKGEWKLIGSNLLNYLLISNRSTQNEIITSVFKEYINQKNFENAERIYQKLVNILDTDITAFDFNSALPALEALSYAEDRLNFTTFTLKG